MRPASPASHPTSKLAAQLPLQHPPRTQQPTAPSCHFLNPPSNLTNNSYFYATKLCIQTLHPAGSSTCMSPTVLASVLRSNCNCAIRRHVVAPLSRPRLLQRPFTMSAKVQEPQITKVSALPAEEAKWVEFQKIEWTDQEGKPRMWEAANRKTRGKSGIDAVAIAPILLHPSRPTQTLIILQYRPPVAAT